MQMKLGETVRKLRLEKGLTQEQLAEAFGVTAQAVSRWENDLAYPDITLLPGLAVFFDTSVDCLLGMDDIRREEALWGIHTRINELMIAGKSEEAVTLIRDSLKIYPNDMGLLMSLGETLARRSEDPEAAREAISIAERVLKCDGVSMKEKATTSANLLFLYARCGKREQAQRLIKSMSHIWESREMLMPEIEDGADYENAMRQAVTKALVYLCRRLDALPGRTLGETPAYVQLGVDFTPEKSTEDMLAQIAAFLREKAD